MKTRHRGCETMEKTIPTEYLIEIEEKEVRTRVVFSRDGERKYRYLLKNNGTKTIKMMLQLLC